jgi:UDP-2,4-diacetamido-2,4,6-trideoxy-beta-L-altropyranose hydrolase
MILTKRPSCLGWQHSKPGECVRSMNSQPLLFRLDAGPEVGIGHWTRCLALSEALKTQNSQRQSFWLVNRESKPLWDRLRAQSIQFRTGDWNAQNTFDVAQELGADTLILDTMNTQTAWVKQVGMHLQIISVGGSGEGRNHVTIRIDGMIPRSEYSDHYKGEKLFLGPEFIILRPPFLDCHSKQTSGTIAEVLVCLGGDAHAYGVQVARALAAQHPDWKIKVMVGSLAEDAYGDLPESVQVLQNIEKPWRIMQASDLAVSAGGMTTFELLHLGVPTLLLPLNPLQLVAASAFDEAGAAVNLGLWNGTSLQVEQKLALVLSTMDLRRRQALSDKGRFSVDGLGLVRVTKIILHQEQTTRKQP